MKKEVSKIIDSNTIYEKADAITIRAILTDYTKSGNETMRELYYSALNFAMSDHTENDERGGADLIQDTALYLSRYMGKSVDDTTGDGQTDNDGNEITILRGAFRNIGRIIWKHRQKTYKQIYITDFENENGEIIVPFEWDIDNYTDFVRIDEIINELNLTANQYQILSYRMRGMSTEKCGQIKGCSRQNIEKVLAKIRDKYIALYGVPATIK